MYRAAGFVIATLVCSAGPALPAQDEAPAYVEIDYAKVERRIAKEPVYVAAPRYALFVFDLAGKHRVWAVADKSGADAPYYDVLYFDLDADGDLTEAGERFTGKYDAKRAAAGMAVTIHVGDVPVPSERRTHTKLLVSTSPKKGRSGFWFRMQWDGEVEVSGGYGAVGMDTTRWGESPAKAPILRPCPRGPLSFALWGTDKVALRAGQEARLNVIAGNPGSGPDTLAVVDENFLDLNLDELTVTVIAKDRDGKDTTAVTRIQGHC